MWDVSWTVHWRVGSNIKSNVRNWVARLLQVFKRPIPYDIFLWFPASGWTRNFRLDYIELQWVNLNNVNRYIIMLLIMFLWNIFHKSWIISVFIHVNNFILSQLRHPPTTRFTSWAAILDLNIMLHVSLIGKLLHGDKSDVKL